MYNDEVHYCTYCHMVISEYQGLVYKNMCNSCRDLQLQPEFKEAMQQINDLYRLWGMNI